MTYVVRVERSVECPTAVVKATTTRQQFPTLWRGMLDEVWALLRTTPGLWTSGHNVMLYRPAGPGELAVEVGVQVTASFEPVGRVLPSTLPACRLATTVHTGPPAGIGAAHAAVRTWCEARSLELSGVSWEIYGDPDPATGHFDVSVCWQLA